MGLHSKRL